MSARRGRRDRFIPRTDGAAAHQDWLSLCAPTLPFLSVPVLTDAFETGPLHIDRDLRAAAISRWDGGDLENGAVDDRDRTAWVEWLLTDLLGFDDRVAKTDRFTTAGTEPGTSVTATYAILDDPAQPATSTTRLLVLVLPAGTSPDGRGGDAWSATWTQRMALLLRRTGVELGMVTDGDLIRIVWAKKDISTGHATWRASLFSSERDHLDALWSVVSARQFFAAHPDEQPEALLQRSLAAEAEVTSALGHQVRRAVELLVTSLDRANRDPETPRFLDGVPPGEVYEAAVTVLMRLVFVLAAEENGLLPVNRALYADQYAISTLRGQLEDDARLGRERLEQRSSGWHRLLAVTRAVHGGLTHEQIAVTAYGGNLFDPDRYPFLEGRLDHNARWWQDPGRPPLVDDLTVLEIMRALQVLQLSPTDTRTLSYKNLEVEQIGHVYEGLLDHSAVSSGDATFLGIVGKQGEEPEIDLKTLEEKLLAGRDKLAVYLAGKDVTGLTKNKIDTLLQADQPAGRLAALRVACAGDQTLTERVAPFLGVLRDDLRGYPLVFPAGSIYVTQTGSRRDSGTAYTTKHLADEVVDYALAPLCYSPGPQDTRDTEQWRPRSSQEILDLKVCDMAVGSGAILVAACRYLADVLIEARIAEGAIDAADLSSAGDDPARNTHRVQAMREVAERCCYGVDRNPMAVEMAKMSFWLVTMARDRPFTYLDHNLQAGDSLLGITDLDQLRALHLNPAFGGARTVGLPGLDPASTWAEIAPLVDRAIELRRIVEEAASDTARDTAYKAELTIQAARTLEVANAIADLMVACALGATGDNHDDDLDQRLRANAAALGDAIRSLEDESAEKDSQLRHLARRLMNYGRPTDAPVREPVHWCLRYPEVFSGNNPGFDAIVGNPPYLGGTKISGPMGTDYRRYLGRWIAGQPTDRANLVCFFFLVASRIICREGLLSLLATSAIRESVSRDVALDSLTRSGFAIVGARSPFLWPGSEGLFVCEVAMFKGQWTGQCVLDGAPVDFVTTSLRPATGTSWITQRLNENSGVCLGGVKPGSTRFLIDDEATRTQLLAANIPVPYLLGGAELNASPARRRVRSVIDLDAWESEPPTALHERIADLKADRPEVKKWWLHVGRAVSLRSALVDSNGIGLAVAEVSPHAMFMRFDFAADVLPSNKLMVVPQDNLELLGVLMSEIHRLWVFEMSQKQGSGHDPTYTPSVVFDPFPFPFPSKAACEAIAERALAIERLRSDVMREYELGLTQVYNSFNDESATEGSWAFQLRELHTLLDDAVLQAYSWESELSPVYVSAPLRDLKARRRFDDRTTAAVLDLLRQENQRRVEAQEDSGAETIRRGSRASSGSRSQSEWRLF